MNDIPNEIIIVEGRDDTKKLIETYGPNIRTIETNGSAINRKVLEQIAALSEKFGVIVFTDPDFQGDRIRRIISEKIPTVKHAYLNQTQASSGKKGRSLGVEHASPEDIRKALSSVVELSEMQDVDLIPVSKLMELELIGHQNAKSNRELVAKHFNLGHINGKQLQKRLFLYKVDENSLNEFMKAVK